MSLDETYPLLLNADEDIIFKEVVDKRLDFSTFFNKKFNPFISKLLKTYLLDTDNYLFIIAGSRAWNNLLSNSNIELTKLESASITPGNYDIFCICKNKKDINNIIIKYCEILDKIALFCEKNKINVNYEINYNNKDNKKNIKEINSIDCVLNDEYSKEGCIFPPCKAMHMEIKDNSKYNEKVLIYLELLLIEKEDIITYVYDNIISKNDNLNFLNLKGIYLFSELIITSRQEKEYDIDTYRKNILQKILEYQNVDKLRIYNDIIKIYTHIFNDRINYKIMKINLIKNFVFLSDKNIIDNYNSYLTEQFRVYINTFVHQTELSINNLNCNIFITGGDAYRRYIPDIKKTNDIDVKICFTKINDYDELLKKVILKMSQLIYVLNTHKISTESDKIYMNNIISIKFIPKYNSGQFRLRYTKNEDFTLLSIDYRYKLKVTINSNTIFINQEFALLDVVLYHDDKYLKLKEEKKLTKKNIQLLDKLNSVYDNQSGLPKIIYDKNIPVASPEYLINDLRGIYENIRDLRRRFSKNSKDKQRFINLIKFIKKYNSDIQHKSDSFNTIMKINTNDDNHIDFKKNNHENYIGENLNIQLIPSYYISQINNKITNQYTDEFIKNINNIDNNKFKMNFEEIYNIAINNNDINIDIENITKKISKVNIYDNMDLDNIDDVDDNLSIINIDNLLSDLDI